MFLASSLLTFLVQHSFGTSSVLASVMENVEKSCKLMLTSLSSSVASMKATQPSPMYPLQKPEEVHLVTCLPVCLSVHLFIYSNT